MNTQGIKNILIGATPNEKIGHGAVYTTLAGAAGGFLATKGVIALTAGSALALTGGWALLAVAVGGIALAILGAIQKYRGSQQTESEGMVANEKLDLQWTEEAKGSQQTESEGMVANEKLDLQWTEEAKAERFKKELNAKLSENRERPVLQGLNPNILSVIRVCNTSAQVS